MIALMLAGALVQSQTALPMSKNGTIVLPDGAEVLGVCDFTTPTPVCWDCNGNISPSLLELFGTPSGKERTVLYAYGRKNRHLVTKYPRSAENGSPDMFIPPKGCSYDAAICCPFGNYDMGIITSDHDVKYVKFDLLVTYQTADVTHIKVSRGAAGTVGGYSVHLNGWRRASAKEEKLIPWDTDRMKAWLIEIDVSKPESNKNDLAIWVDAASNTSSCDVDEAGHVLPLHFKNTVAGHATTWRFQFTKLKSSQPGKWLYATNANPEYLPGLCLFESVDKRVTLPPIPLDPIPSPRSK